MVNSEKLDIDVSRRTFLASTTIGALGIGTLRATSISPARAQSTPALGWFQDRYDGSRSGSVTGWSSVTQNLAPEWILEEQRIGQPISDGDKVYVTKTTIERDDPTLVALSPDDGSIYWEQSITNDYREPTSRESTPIVAEDSVYFSDGEQTKAFDVNDGAVEWTSSTGGSWLIQDNGYLYISGTNGSFTVLDTADGSVEWDGIRSSNEQFIAPQYCVNNGSLYLGTERRSEKASTRIIAVDSTSGKPEWKTKLDAEAPEIAANEHGVVVATNTDLYLLDPSGGSVQWEINGRPLKLHESSIVSSPIVSEDSVYCTVGDELLKVDIQTGATTWTAQKISSPVMVGDHIYGLNFNSLRVIDAESGTTVSSYEFSDGRTPSGARIAPLEEMILVGLTEYYDGYEEYPVAGRPLIALGGN